LSFPKHQEAYTSPTVRLADGETYVMDSKNIATRIEADTPTPSIHLDSPYITRIEELVGSLHVAFRPAAVALVPDRLLTAASAPYFRETRAKRFGAPLDEIAKGAGKATDDARPLMLKITAMLRENTDGPFFMGQTVSYADFVWIGYLLFVQRVGDDVFKKLMDASGDDKPHVALLEAAKTWTARDSY
jgi:glutathione S-transferase